MLGLQRRMALAAGCATLVATSAAASIQTYSGPENQKAWEWPVTAGGFAGIAQGFLAGEDPLPDAVALFEGQMVLIYGPGETHAHYPFGGADATAFAVWSRAAQGLKDLVVVATPAGLEVWEWDSADGAMEEWASTLASGAGFASAKGLAVEIDTGSSATRLSGLAADGQTLFAGTLSGSAYSEYARFAPGGSVAAWCALQWNGVGPCEFAAQTGSGLMVHAADGTPLLAAPLPALTPVSRLTCFRDPLRPFDRLVFTTLDASSAPIVRVVDNRWPLCEAPLALVGDPGQVLVFDATADGRPDLLVSYQSAHEARMLFGRPSPSFPTDTTFDPTNGISYGLQYGSNTTISAAALATHADFDLDGDRDLLLVSSNFEHVNFLRATAVDDLTKRPAFDTLGFATALTMGGQLIYQLDVELDLPLAEYPPGSISHVETQAFYQSGLGATIDFVPDDSALTPVSGRELVVGLDMDVTGEHPQSAVYQLRLRMLATSSGPQVGPSLILYFASSADVHTALGAQHNAWDLPGYILAQTPYTPGVHKREDVAPVCASCPP